MDLDITDLLCFAVTGDSKQETADVLNSISNQCLELFEKDYTCEILENLGGNLCGSYPDKIFLPLASKEDKTTSKIKDHVLKARLARTRGRFVVPVLVVDDKYICRSSTLARSPEVYCRQTYGYYFLGDHPVDSKTEAAGSNVDEETSLNTHNNLHSDETVKPEVSAQEQEKNEWLLDKIRNADISFLRYLKVNFIFDLMVEKKKVKYGMNVTSSEKADRSQRYQPFHLISIPYPGCEFFTDYKNAGYNADNLMYDWKQPFVDALLQVPPAVHDICNIVWDDYKNWDLATMTKNYLLLHLRLLVHKDCSGVLLHCISGWDRTPLFVSLMRLSLWADGLAHTSLNSQEIAFFTVAYDWLLFQHQFPERIYNGEEIFFFCFNFLEYICGEDFSLTEKHDIHEKKEFPNTKPVSNGKSNGCVNAKDVLQDVGLVSHCDGGNAIFSQCENQTPDVLSHDPEESYTVSNGGVHFCNSEDIQSAVLPVQQMQEEELQEAGTPPTASERKIKLMEVRELVIEAYKSSINCYHERTKNPGIAAYILGHLARPFSSLAKK